MFEVGDKVVITNLKGYNGTNPPPEWKEGFVGKVCEVGRAGWAGCVKLEGYHHWLSELRVAIYVPQEEAPVIAEEVVEYAVAHLVIKTNDPELAYKGKKPDEIFLIKREGRWVQATPRVTFD